MQCCVLLQCNGQYIYFADCRKQDVDRAGSNIGASTIVTNIEACVAQCDSLPECKAWTFSTSDTQCWSRMPSHRKLPMMAGSGQELRDVPKQGVNTRTLFKDVYSFE